MVLYVVLDKCLVSPVNRERERDDILLLQWFYCTHSEEIMVLYVVLDKCLVSPVNREREKTERERDDILLLQWFYPHILRR